MIQLNILSGKQAGNQKVVRRFPFRIGRAQGNELQLDDDGIWDQHLTLKFQPKVGFVLLVASEAIVTVNGSPVQEYTLRNGDIITIGSVKLQFWLAAGAQGSLCLREAFVWTMLALVTICQFILLYWLVG